MLNRQIKIVDDSFFADDKLDELFVHALRVHVKQPQKEIALDRDQAAQQSLEVLIDTSLALLSERGNILTYDRELLESLLEKSFKFGPHRINAPAYERTPDAGNRAIAATVATALLYFEIG